MSYTPAMIARIEADALLSYENNGHSLLSPSGVSTWANCAGVGVNLHEDRKTSPDSEASVEGTFGHFVLEICCVYKCHPSQLTPAHTHPIKQDAHNWMIRIQESESNPVGVKKFSLECYERLTNMNLTDEMIYEIGRTFDVIMTYVSAGWTLYPELKVSLRWFVGHSQCDGTSDVVLVKGTKLIVADLKYGKSLPVHPYQNFQIILYALGVIAKLAEENGGFNYINEVELVIMQSRIDDNVWESWHTSYGEIYNLVVPNVKDASIRALEVIAYPEKVNASTFNPSDESCTWCHRKKGCIARRDYAKKLAINAFKRLDPLQSDNFKPDNPFLDIISDGDLKQILLDLPFIVAYLKSAEKLAHERRLKGNKNLGLKLVEGRNKRTYYEDKTENVKIQNLLNAGVPFDKAVTITAKTPPQLDKLNLDPEVRERTNLLVKHTKSKPVVALDSDSRKAFDPAAKAREAFEKSDNLYKS